MGSVCCCFNAPDHAGDNAASNDQNHNNCQCFRCCFQNIITKCGAIFGQAQAQGTAGPAANQRPSSSTAVVAVNNPCNTTVRALPDNAALRQPQVQQGVTLRRQDKGTGQSRVEPEPVGVPDVEITQKLLGLDKLLKESCCDSPEKDYSSQLETGFLYVVSSSEDEDVCPTCLEEYTPENPKISTKCSHHFHLSCIYEWQERSEKCPMCGKLMEFVETN